MSSETVSTRVLTAPNVISFARLSLVPLFLWIFLRGQHDFASFLVIVVLGSSDWIDGFVARRTGQISVLGKLLDPVADRIAIVAVMLALVFRGVVYWPFATAILARDAIVSVVFPVLEAKGFPRIPVNFVGKTATFLIFSGMGLAMGGLAFPGFQPLIGRLSNGYLAVGSVLYWLAGAMYVGAIRTMIRSTSR